MAGDTSKDQYGYWDQYGSNMDQYGYSWNYSWMECSWILLDSWIRSWIFLDIPGYSSVGKVPMRQKRTRLSLLSESSVIRHPSNPAKII